MAQSVSLHNNSAASSIQVSGFSRLLDPQQYPNNLPLQLTSFIGRESDISAIKQQLWTTRLLTLTGPGGCGKTRLALRVAADLLDAFADGVWWIELAALMEPALIAQTLATTLGLYADTGRPIDDVLIDYLRSRQILLILDNCEHLIEVCARLTQTLLQACPDLYILATSREVLRIGGEVPYMVPPLATPHPNQLPGVEALAHYEAVKLFVERAANAWPDFELTERNAAAIAQVCYRLDGMPLAIELAAARVKMLPVDQIVARLDDRFRLLTGGSRTTLLRHQTLLAAIDWSYDLLSEDERRVLRRLSVFAGGWTLEAAEAVCADRAEEEPANVTSDAILNLLTQLINKSLVVVEREQGVETRYRMLETIRQYAQDKLAESPELPVLRDRHLSYYAALAERAEPLLHGPQQVLWLNRLDTDYDNVRAAVTWATVRRETGTTEDEGGLRLCSALVWYWHERGHVGEARRWTEHVLAGTSSHTLAYAKALSVAGFLAIRQEDDNVARAKLQESITTLRSLGPTATGALSDALFYLALVAEAPDDDMSAVALYQESLDLRQVVGNQWGVAQCLGNIGGLAIAHGDFATARLLLENGLDVARTVGDASLTGLMLTGNARLAARQGDYATARAQVREALRIQRDLGGGSRTIMAITALAEIEGQSDQPARLENAIRLRGAAEALATARGDLFGYEAADVKEALSAVRTRLAAAAIDAAWTEGQAMTLNEAIDYALAVPEASPTGEQSAVSPRATKQQFGGLTKREREVAALVAQGKPNREIAQALVLSEYTIATHVSNILSKLEFSSRTQIVSWAIEKGLSKFSQA